jgi:hypothetical protein
VYDHTHIASYWCWCVGNVGKRVQLLALDGRNAELAGVFQVTLFCPVHAEYALIFFLPLLGYAAEPSASRHSFYNYLDAI